MPKKIATNKRLKSAKNTRQAPKKKSRSNTPAKKRATTSPARSFKPRMPIQIRDELFGFLLLFAAIFMYLGVHNPASSGLAGEWLIQKGIQPLFGYGAYYFPIFLGIGALSLMAPFSRWRQAMTALSLCYVAFLVYLEMTINGYAGAMATPYPINGGGVLGYLALAGLDKMIGQQGASIVIVAMLVATPLLVFNFSFVQAITSFTKWTFAQAPVKALLSQLKTALFFTHVEPESPFVNAKYKTKKQNASTLKYAPNPTQMVPPKKTANSAQLPPSEPIPTAFEMPDFKEDVIEVPTVQIDPVPEPDPVIEPALPKPTVIAATYDEQPGPKKGLGIAKTADGKPYKRPPLSLLAQGDGLKAPTKEMVQHQEAQSLVLEEALASFNVKARVVNVTVGPSVTRFELEPGDGVKVSKITSLSKDIALKLAAPDVRIEAPIPGKSLVGIEVPNLSTDVITLRMLLNQAHFFDKPSRLLTALGMSITGEALYMDLAKMPHILIAGATGSGKSVCINTIILSILMKATPDEVRFLMIDPKKVELSLYEGIPHLVAPVVTNPHKAAATLKQWALVEMERRYEAFSTLGVKDLSGFNAKLAKASEQLETDPEKALKTIKILYPNAEEDDEDLAALVKPLPQLVVIIDELADLMMVASQEVENTICRLAQMARATGIHLVIATQRPSVNVITGLIKANVPSRISFFLQSQIDSRTILDSPGAEKLLGKGDMLYMPVGAFKPKRLQGVFVTEKEVKDVVGFLKKQGGPSYESSIEDIEPLSDSKAGLNGRTGEDELFEEAKELVLSTRYASTSYLQRKLRIGYNRAARLMDELEEHGVISAFDGEKKSREVLS